MPDKVVDLNRTQEIRTGSRTGRKIKVVNGNIKKEVRKKPKTVNYKNLIPEDKNSSKEKQAPVLKEPEPKKVEIEKKEDSVQRNEERKIKKVRIKDVTRDQTKEEKRDPKLEK